jgi:transposase
MAARQLRLSVPQGVPLDAALRRGDKAHGSPIAAWTVPRVTPVIARESGGRYQPGHVWRSLRATLNLARRPAAPRSVTML